MTRRERVESRRRSFLAELRRCLSVTEAARASGVPRHRVYKWRARSPEFREAWREAGDSGVADRLGMDLAEYREECRRLGI